MHDLLRLLPLPQKSGIPAHPQRADPFFNYAGDIQAPTMLVMLKEPSDRGSRPNLSMALTTR